MERAKRIRKAAALINAILLIGLVVAFTTGIVFIGGSKSSKVFSFIGTAPSRTPAPNNPPVQGSPEAAPPATPGN